MASLPFFVGDPEGEHIRVAATYANTTPLVELSANLGGGIVQFVHSLDLERARLLHLALGAALFHHVAD